MAAIDYYYAPISGYAYLGEPRLKALAKRMEVTIRYRPVDIAAVFKASETVPPFAQSEARLSYRFEDMERWAAKLGLPIIAKPPHWPVPVGLACGVIYAADALGADTGAASFAMLKGVYADGKNMSEPADVWAALTAAGLDADALMKMAETDEVAAMAAAATEEAIRLKVFGSPTYIFNGQRFFGQDRIDFLEDALEAACSSA